MGSSVLACLHAPQLGDLSTHLVGEAHAEAQENTADDQHGEVDGAGAKTSPDQEEDASTDHGELAAVLASEDAGEDRGEHTCTFRNTLYQPLDQEYKK